MDQKMPNPQSSSAKLLTFDASVAKHFVVKKEWKDLEDYLGKFIATVLKKTPDEVIMMHPGLFMIPREERLLDLLSDRKFEEADSFYQKSVELLRGCRGKFVALDFRRKIDDLNTILKSRSMPSIRRSTESIESSISDYIHLYFPSAICRDNDEVEGFWQFAMKLPKPNKQARWDAFRCLACGWICPGSQSISYMTRHIMQSKDCKVTDDMLHRLKALVMTKDVQTLETNEYLFKKRKTISESVSSSPDTQPESLFSGEVSSTICLKALSSTSVEDKRSRKEPISAANSPCLGTPAKKMKPQLAATPSPIMSYYPVADYKHLSQMVEALESVTCALALQISTSVVPEARIFFLKKIFDLQQVALDLFPFHKQLSQTAEVLKSVAGALAPQIRTSVVPDARIFFMEKIFDLQQVALDLFSFVLNTAVDGSGLVLDSASAQVPEE